MRLPPRVCVCRFFFFEIFSQKPENIEFCVVFDVFAKVPQITQLPSSSCFFAWVLGSFLKFLFGEPREREYFFVLVAFPKSGNNEGNREKHCHCHINIVITVGVAIAIVIFRINKQHHSK